MSIFNIVHVEEVCFRGSVKDADVAALSDAVAAQRSLDATTIDDLFRINVLCHLQTSAWSTFFIETVTDWLVREQQPSGYMTLEQVRYLLERIERNDRIETKAEFDLLLNLLEKSRWAPVRLPATALKEVHGSIATGVGVLRGGQDRASGEITTSDISCVRHILYAYGGDEALALTRAETDFLFDIDECHRASAPAPEWNDLFMLAVLNVMLASSGYRVPTREAALVTRSPAEQDDATGSGSVRMIERIIGCYTRLSSEERAIQRLERQRIEIVTGEKVEEPDAIWIAERLDERLRQASDLAPLMNVLRDREMRLHPTLQRLVSRHAKAA